MTNLLNGVYQMIPKTGLRPPSLVSKHAGNGKSKRKKKRGKK